MVDKYKVSHPPVAEIDRLRFQAFKTNSATDMDAYYKATSSYFQDRHVRAMNREILSSKEASKDG